ncbi:hypothetical protein [Lacticaseibacillus daqingensis]|uniref:hypothetical protein n=1 Tax=Lacticaseibacillus daqingensis TaxID=2486014 RepID=UPI000F7ABE97|nr:hypothetical protein [Lacticaseibacillus daqingensis]
MLGIVVPAVLLALILLAVGVILLVSAKKAPVSTITRWIQIILGVVMIGGSVYWMAVLWSLASGM